MKTLFCVIGRTGTGKDTVVNQVCDLTGMTTVKSYTTRPRRENEKDTHVFISSEEVAQYKNDIAAYTKIGDVEYFATVQQVLDGDFYIIDPKGLRNLLENWNFASYPMKVVVIYLTVADGAQMLFLRNRGDSREAAAKRIIAEDEQFKLFEKEHRANYTLFNDELYNTVIQLIGIVNKEKEGK